MARFVVIVEDDKDLRPEMVESLRKRGCRVSGCESLAAARRVLEEALAKNAPPQYVICDIGLPDGDGLTLFSSFAPRLPAARWMLISGSHDLARLGASLKSLPRLNPPLVIEKPFSLTTLREFVGDKSPGN